jgi:O-antigen ligase
VKNAWLDKIERKHVIGLGLAVALINVFFIVTENYWGLLLPFLLAVVALIVLSLDKVLLFLVFATPLSIFFFHPKLGTGLTLPTEPLLFGIMILFFARVLYRGGFDRKVFFHPLSLAIVFNLLWVFVTSITSELPLVSFKFFVARLWFVSVCFYLMSQLFKEPKNVVRFFWLFAIPLCLTVIYTLTVHAQNGFTKEASVWVMFPFFKEHTIYGAVLALFIPLAFVFTFNLSNSLNSKLVAGLVLTILLVGVILSFTRAAWVSLAAALGVAALIVLRVKPWLLLMLFIGFLGVLGYYKEDIFQRFESNQATSSDDLGEHVSSISNISTDASNMERINRWKSALRMFAERPITGFGPGTYMFLYAPYQKPYEKTIISTNAGNAGNAHSEYIGPMAESGILGLLTTLAVVYFTLSTGVRVYYRLENPYQKRIALAVLMGLVTYWTHGLLNNFLDSDKAALPVYAFTALLVVYDKYYLPKKLERGKRIDTLKKR